ncbi:hypothetical protein GGR56DRAFT_678933 [Xylariaceae sp. FL0804]|nr:hypothetical protein GGR56DRAFT_678933 [Xylariaceae sp. FL0804]
MRILGWQEGLHPDDQEKAPSKQEARKVYDLSEASNHSLAQLPYFYCSQCGLTYLAGGGPGRYEAHPSHVSADNQRYLIVQALPRTFEVASLRKIRWRFDYIFGSSDTALNAVFKNESPAESEESTCWNFDNAEIDALTSLLHQRFSTFSYGLIS